MQRSTLSRPHLRCVHTISTACSGKYPMTYQHGVHKSEPFSGGEDVGATCLSEAEIIFKAVTTTPKSGCQNP